MPKKLTHILIFNVLIAVLFVISNLYIWGFINLTNDLSYSIQISINPLIVEISHIVQFDGMINSRPPTYFPNFPFILFFVAIGGNLWLFNKAQKNKETKQTPS
jgi:hypothetical protein